MKTVKDNEKFEKLITREEEGVLLNFLSTVTPEVRKFNNVYGFDIEGSPAAPLDIDGDFDLPQKTSFILYWQ